MGSSVEGENTFVSCNGEDNGRMTAEELDWLFDFDDDEPMPQETKEYCYRAVAETLQRLGITEVYFEKDISV